MTFPLSPTAAYGVESSVSLANKDSEEVLATLEKMATTEMPRD